MTSVSETRVIGGRLNADAESSPLFTVRLLGAFSEFVESHGWVIFAAVSLICGWIHLKTVASRPLDHDELYTFYIAQAPTLKQLLALTRTVDLHPPLSYLLIRASFAIFGISAWACRLPSVLAFLLATAVLFWLVRRILGSVYATVALLFFWSVPFSYHADEARPYSLVLCFTALMLATWYRAIDDSDSTLTSSTRRFTLLALSAGGFGLLLSHVLAVLPYCLFFAAELVRFWLRRKTDWRLWLALLVPAMSGLTYLPLLRIQSGILFASEYRPTPLLIFTFYWDSVRTLVLPLAAVAVLVVLGPLFRQSKACDRQSTNHLLPTTLYPLGCLLFGLCLVPLAVGILFARSGTAFFERYGIVIFIPIALIPALLLALRTRRNQTAGAAVALFLGVVLFLNTSGRFWLIEQLGNLAPPQIVKYTLYAFALPQIVPQQAKPRVPAHLQKALQEARPVTNLDSIDSDLPLVANTGLTFLEIDRRGDAALTKRLYLLSDPQAAASVAHDTVFENYDRLLQVFPIRGKVAPYCAFIRAHSRFLVLGAYNHPQGWLLKKLDMDGADLRMIGTYDGITEEAQLYEVSISQPDCTERP
jgi:dolichyl-phosphate-mannose-protein mannosyltransferase